MNREQRIGLAALSCAAFLSAMFGVYVYDMTPWLQFPLGFGLGYSLNVLVDAIREE